MNKILVIFLLIGVLFISGCVEETPTGQIASKETEMGEPKVTTSTTVPTTTTSTTSTTTTIAKMKLVGETLQIENMKYKVMNVYTSPIVGTEMLYEQADGIYVIITLSIENTGKESNYIAYTDFSIKDYQDRTYDVDMMGNVYLDTMGVTALPSIKDLGAGLTTQGSIVFDVPKNDKGLVLEIKGPGLFSGTGTIIIGDISDL